MFADKEFFGRMTPLTSSRNGFIFILTGLILLLFYAAISAPHAETVSETERLILKTAKRSILLDVEVADDPAERSKGLMHRPTLPPMQGMLFDFGETRKITMWMKDTEISLDMFFVDASGKILYIKDKAVPHSLDVVTFEGAARAVLELNGGFAHENSVKIGDVLYHPIFENQ